MNEKFKQIYVKIKILGGKMKKIVITLNAEQKVAMAKELGIINDELIIMIPEENEEKSNIQKIENSMMVTFLEK